MMNTLLKTISIYRVTVRYIAIVLRGNTNMSTKQVLNKSYDYVANLPMDAYAMFLDDYPNIKEEDILEITIKHLTDARCSSV